MEAYKIKNNIESGERNIYTKDLNFSDEGLAQVVFETNSEQLVSIVVKKDGEQYNFESWIGKDDFIESRVSSRSSVKSEAQMSTSLRDLQYILRKEYVKEEEKEVEVEVEVEAEEAPKRTPKKKTASKAAKIEVPQTGFGLDAMIFGLVEQSIKSEASGEIITETVREFLDEHGIVPNKTEVVVKRPDGTKKDAGMQHKLFKKILQVIGAGVNLALVGPAGSGKTTCVKNCAAALDLPFYSQSVSSQTATFDFFGYQDANGNYVRTLFREAYEKGGVFLLDEFDAGNPNVLAALNQATANDSCAFADGMIDKHADFIVVMAGNTFGHGATSEYVGRNKIDAATLDRFAFLYFGYDEDFEYNLASNKDWCKKVQKFRKTVETKKIKTIISPRATFDGSKMLSAGMAEKDVVQMLIYKGLTQTEINLLKS